ncbi:MAG: helix-turn-helix domain-containing protein [Candidatus Diapherotrites archaeon]|nr:helix-turn-helix domain-containing protein [Candidatus Diapherotrites archaeon]
MDNSILEDIGLTQSEIKVYTALLKLGPSSAGPILDKTNLHNSVVHMTLNRLLEKGLISYFKEGKKHIYQASNPKHILEFIDEKKERFETILPELLAKQAESKEKPEVTIYRGIKGMREILYELLDAGGKEHHTIGSSIKSLAMGEKWWEQYHSRRAKKGIVARLLFYESLREWNAEKKYPKSTEIRYTDTGFEPLTETIIRNDKVGILIWTEKPIGTLIQNKELAESYDKYFWLLWNKTKSKK